MAIRTRSWISISVLVPPWQCRLLRTLTVTGDGQSGTLGRRPSACRVGSVRTSTGMEGRDRDDHEGLPLAFGTKACFAGRVDDAFEIIMSIGP